MRLSLYGDPLALYGNALALYADAAAIAPRGDDAFRTSGARDRFWQSKAEEELAELLEQAQEAVRAPVAARKAVAEEFALIEWQAMPQAPQIGAMLEQLIAPAPDYSHLAAMILEQMQRIEAARIKARRKRDIEAVLLLS